MVKGGGGAVMGGDAEMAQLRIHESHQFVQHLVQYHATFTEPHHDQRQLKDCPTWNTELTFGVNLGYEIL